MLGVEGAFCVTMVVVKNAMRLYAPNARLIIPFGMHKSIDISMQPDHYCDVTRETWRLKSLTTTLFVHRPVRSLTKRTPELCVTGPLQEETTGPQWNPSHKWSVMWKAFSMHDVIILLPYTWSYLVRTVRFCRLAFWCLLLSWTVWEVDTEKITIIMINTIVIIWYEESDQSKWL